MPTIEGLDDDEESPTIGETGCYGLNPAEGRVEGRRVQPKRLKDTTPGAAEGTEGN